MLFIAFFIIFFVKRKKDLKNPQMVKRDPFFSSSDQEDLPIALPCSYNPLPDEPPADDDSPASLRRPIAWVVLFFSSFLVICFLVAIIGEICSESHADVDGSFSMPKVSPPTSVAPETLLPMSRGVSAGVSEKANLQLPSFPWNNSMLSWQRTAFHFQPVKNWMNDPNGPLWYKGWYHLFYQYNPNGAVWGNIVWGHAVSSNLIHWLHLPFALIPDQWYDINGVFTGSATVFPDGQIVVLYTGSTKDSVQVQNLAFPQNPSDPLLLSWVKYPRNPVLVPPPGIQFKDFRDPTTAWLTTDGKWRFTVGSKVGRTGISLLYETQDFKHYELLDGLLHAVSGTGMWECVDFFPVSVSLNNGLDTSVQGPGVKHVIKASFDDDRHDYYSIGTYDESSGTWVPDDRNFDIGNGFRYDYGLFYASKTFYDQNRKRRILWGWIGESDSQYADIQKDWASVQSIPRTVLLDMKTGKNLLQWPVEEVESLRLTSHKFENLEVKAGSVLPLNIGLATQLDIIAEFELDEEDLYRASQSNAKFSCSASRGAAERGALGPFGLLVLADDTLSERTPVYFYVAKGENDNLETFICSDQSKSSKANDVIKNIYGSSVPVLKGEKFSLRILVDHSIVESFAQGGRACITSRVYPTKALYGAARLFVFNNATGADVKVSLSIWQMSSADIRPFPANPEK